MVLEETFPSSGGLSALIVAAFTCADVNHPVQLKYYAQ
jgi:hypothetical protein